MSEKIPATSKEIVVADSAGIPQTTNIDPPKSQFTTDEISRLWEHGMHEDNMLNNRLNFFIALESILLGVVGVLFGQNSTNANYNLVLKIFLGMGLFITVIWFYVSARQRYVYDSLRNILRENLPEYDKTMKARESKRWPLSSTTLLTYVLPCSFIIIWIVLQAVAWVSNT